MPVVGNRSSLFFKRGLPLTAKLAFYLVMTLTLLVGDLHLRYLDTLRRGIAILTYPLQVAAATPGEFLGNVGQYFSSLLELQQENGQLKSQQLADARELLRVSQLQQENVQLRDLLQIRQRVVVKSIAAEVMFAARDPFSLKVVLDKGSDAGVEPGLAVVDQQGMIGQVTRVYPMNSEVTLLTDKNQAVPVVVERSGLRAVMFGTGSGLMELRYLAANADVRTGDRILTSGLDGVFVSGLPVATVMGTTRGNNESFVRILCKPLGGVEKASFVLVLQANTQGVSMLQTGLPPSGGGVTHGMATAASAPVAIQSAPQSVPVAGVAQSAPRAATRTAVTPRPVRRPAPPRAASSSVSSTLPPASAEHTEP